MITLPPANKAFEHFFLPWHDGDEPAAPRADTYATMPGQMPRLRADYEGLLADYLLVTLPDAARASFSRISPFERLDMAGLAIVDRYYDRKKICRLIQASNPADFSNEYLVAVSQFGVMLATLLLRRQGFAWQYAHPYFHSVIVHVETGTAIPVFDWALKKFSSDGMDENMVDKLQAVVNRLVC